MKYLSIIIVLALILFTGDTSKKIFYRIISSEPIKSQTCDSGNLQAGNCVYKKFKIDRSCGNQIDLRQLDTVVDNKILDKINPKIQTEIESFFAKNTLAICCGKCSNPKLPQLAVPSSLCAVTPPGNTAIILNTEPYGIFGKGQCGSGGFSENSLSLIFHELLHVVGISGVRAHTYSSFQDPNTLADVQPRDFIPDPVFGCEKSVFGKAQYKNTFNCISCANAILDQDGGSTVPTKINKKYKDALEALVNGIGPDYCKELMSKESDKVITAVRQYNEIIKPINNLEQSLYQCSDDNYKFRNISDLKNIIAKTDGHLENPCAEDFDKLMQACLEIENELLCKTDDYKALAKRCNDVTTDRFKKIHQILKQSKSFNLMNIKQVDCDKIYKYPVICNGEDTLVNLTSFTNACNVLKN